MKYDWNSIKKRYLDGEKISHISASLKGKPTVSAIWKRMKTENWEAFNPAAQSQAQALRKDVEETRRKILQFLESGATLKLAAQAAGVSYDTLANWRKTNPEFKALVEQAQGKFAVDHLAVIDTASRRGDTRSAMWMIERNPVTRGDYSPPRTEGGGSGGVQVILNIPRSESEIKEYQGRILEGEIEPPSLIAQEARSGTGEG